jgi:hypothetical protein
MEMEEEGELVGIFREMSQEARDLYLSYGRFALTAQAIAIREYEKKGLKSVDCTPTDDVASPRHR